MHLALPDKRGELLYLERPNRRKSVKSAYLLDLISFFLNSDLNEVDFSNAFFLNYQAFTTSAVVLENLITLMQNSSNEDDGQANIVR